MMDFIINGESGFKHGCYLSEFPNFPTSTRDVTFVDVPGREHGALTEMYGWKDSTLSLSISVLDMRKVRQVMRDVVGWLYGAKTIAFSDDPTFYFKIKNVVMGDATNQMDVIGSFTVQMEIDPFQYQDTVPIYATKAFELYNPGTANAEPTITLYGNGQLEILIDNRRLKLLNVKDSITLDTEMQTAETGTESKETDMIGDFPYFELRANTISFTADRIKIEPNWRWLM